MNFNFSSQFSQVISFLVRVFTSVLSWLDSIIIIGNNTSLLDLNIAFTVFGIIFAAVFSVVRSGSVNSMDSVEVSRSLEKQREMRRQDREFLRKLISHGGSKDEK